MFEKRLGAVLTLCLLAGSSILYSGCMGKGHTSLTREELPGKIVFGTLNDVGILEPASAERFPRRIMRAHLAHPTWDSLRNRIVFSRFSTREKPGEKLGRILYSTDIRGDKEVHIIGVPGGAFDSPSLSPTGKTLALLAHSAKYARGYARAPTGKLMLMDMETKRTRVLFPTAVLSSRPSWSPDSKRLMFSSVDSLIMVLEVATGRQDTLLWKGTKPSWSPDGHWVAYYCGGRIHIADMAARQKDIVIPRWNLRRRKGGPVRLILDEGEELVWSPDSKYLLYNARSFAGIMGTGTDYMIVRISDGATMRRSWTMYGPTGACWFE